MTKEIAQSIIRTFAELLKVQNLATDRMDTLEKFDEVFAVSIPDWEEQMKEYLRQGENAEDAIQSVEEFYAKYHVYDEEGNLVYNRFRVGNPHHTLTITFDSSAPEGQQIKVEEQPTIDSMGLEELREYYEELEDEFSNLEDEEPEEDSDEYDHWEEELSEIESLMEEVQERIDELEEETRRVAKFGFSVEIST